MDLIDANALKSWCVELFTFTFHSILYSTYSYILQKKNSKIFYHMITNILRETSNITYADHDYYSMTMRTWLVTTKEHDKIISNYIMVMISFGKCIFVCCVCEMIMIIISWWMKKKLNQYCEVSVYNGCLCVCVCVYEVECMNKINNNNNKKNPASCR